MATKLSVRRPTRVARLGRFAAPLLLIGLLCAPAAFAQTSQTITFGALSSKTYGAAPFTVSATATSGLPVSFASLTTPVCTVSTATVTIVAAGTCTIQASQAGNATYAPAPNVNQSFTVSKANQTITFGSLSGKTYGAAPFTVSATASSGLTVAFSSQTTPVCTVSGTTVTIVAAGTCTIRASQSGNSNYNAASNVNQSFAVAKASQTITFNALADKPVGSAPFTVSAAASSGLAVTFSSTSQWDCTTSGNTVTIVAGGTCTIQGAQAGNSNYSAAPNVSQSFNITGGGSNQTITFGALSNRAYGSGSFTVSATASSGLAVTFASTTTSICTVSAGTVSLVAVGTCSIRASQAGNASWNPAPWVTQGFSITKGNQTITFGALASQPLGNPPFTASATASSGLTVTFSSQTASVCTVSGTTVTLVAVGTCTVRAAQSGNSNWNAATSVNQSFSVTSGAQNQTITFGALADRAFGSGNFSVSATASSGLAVSFASTTTPICTVAGGTVTLVAVGLCTIQASQAGNGSWNPAPNVNQSFNVTKGSQTITFGALANRALGSGSFTVSATASSGLTVTFTSTTTPVCTVSGSAVTLVAVGTCTIQASQAGNANWNAATSVNQSFSVTAPVSLQYFYDPTGNVTRIQRQ